MSAKIIQIAEAVVTLLNAGEFELEFTAARRYEVDFKLKDEPDTLRVSVVPREDAETGASRVNRQHDYGIDIGIQQKVDPASLETLDGLVALVEAIHDHLAAPGNRRLPGLTEAVLSDIRTEPIFAPDHLGERRVFTSVVRATYRAIRA